MTVTERERVDAVSALSQPRVETGWIVPGPAQLVLGGASLQALDETPIEVDLLEERGSEVRVGVRLDHARFAVWTARAKLLGVLTREVTMPGLGVNGAMVMLRSGTHVHRLEHKAEDKKTKVRYVGLFEVEGWVPDDAIGDRGPAGRVAGHRRYGGRRTMMVQPGATIRADKRRNTGTLAVAHTSTFIELVESYDDGWQLVAYSDGDVVTTGYYLKTEAPSVTHPVKKPDPSQPIATNITVPADTCLYAGDEPIGFIVGDRPVLVESSPRVGWFTLTIDSPWGPIEVEAKGPTETSLSTCAGATP